METKSIEKYQEFLNKSLLIDQTHLVSEILQKNALDHNCQIFNQLEYRGELSDGIFTATEELLHSKKEEIQKEIDKLKAAREQNTVLDHKSMAEAMDKLTSDLKKITALKARKRQVYNWLLIPHWLSNELVNMGEVVFRAFSCNWYGVSSLLDPYSNKDAVCWNYMKKSIFYHPFKPVVMSQGNILFELYANFANLPIHFRELVSHECDWSSPTFYRKLKDRDKIEKGRIIPALSRAERDAIIKKALEAYQIITDFLESIKNNY